MINETVALLGLRATDKVTGFSGTISTVGFDLYGCVQIVLTPLAIDGKMGEAVWFDVNRLTISSDRAMAVPAFGERPIPTTYPHGASPKPSFGAR